MNKEILKLIKRYFIIVSILLLILTIVNFIPKKLIEDNVKQSVSIFIKEGQTPKLNFTYQYRLDNFTDALMINTAYSVDPDEPLKSAVLMRRNYRPNEDLKLIKIDNETNTIGHLNETLEGSNKDYYEYSRYWHGYMIFLRPLLVFFNYSQIRIILTIIIINLSLLLIYFTYKKINAYASLATLLMLIVSSFYFIGLSLQYSSVYIIMLVTSLWIILRYEKIKSISSIFFTVGILTSFFDLLTTPILTLGIPVIYYILIRNKEDQKDNLKILFKIMIYWCLGYGIMWISKWIISDCLYNTGTIARALEKITLLSNSKEQLNPNAIEVITSNMTYINETFIVALIMISIIFSLMNKNNIRDKIPYIIISVIPFLWYVLIKNHSYVHARFTYRNLLLTVLSLSIITMVNIKEYLNISKTDKSK